VAKLILELQEICHRDPPYVVERLKAFSVAAMWARLGNAQKLTKPCALQPKIYLSPPGLTRCEAPSVVPVSDASGLPARKSNRFRRSRERMPEQNLRQCNQDDLY